MGESLGRKMPEAGDQAEAGREDLDVRELLRQGAIGALGAIPGTICAHPCDVIKIKMQITGAGSYKAAFSSITGSGVGFRGFYRGLVPAIEQRMVARGPMFLMSELFTQNVERYGGLTGAKARFVGSVGSGYTVGFLAGLAEYRKKMLSQNVITAQEARWGNIIKSAQSSGHSLSLFRRLHAAGCCAAVFDSIFFSTQHVMAQNMGYSAPVSYGCAAAMAVCCGFLADTTVARMLVIPPNKPVIPFSQSFWNLIYHTADNTGSGVSRALRGARVGFRGLPARVVEFSISYTVTGFVSIPVVAYINNWV